MSEDTTTSDSVDSGAEQAQLEEIDQAEAVNQDEDTSQANETDESESSNEDDSEDTELKDWAAKKNLPLDDPIKLAKMYREAEQKLGKKGQKEGQLKTAVSTANATSDTDNYQALKNEVEALSFFVNHPEAKQFETEMVGILEEKPWLASDLEVVLDVAKGRSTAATRLADRRAGSQEALAQAEQAGRAAQPRASATNSAKATNSRITMDNVDQLIQANGHEWYMKNRDKINAVLANG